MTVDTRAPQHLEGGSCWCEAMMLREAALDRIYPDRCAIPTDPGTPNPPNLRLCTEPSGHSGPCRMHLERTGGPCHFCGSTFTGESCPTCWESLDGMNLADLKAVFADIDLSVESADPQHRYLPEQCDFWPQCDQPHAGPESLDSWPT